MVNRSGWLSITPEPERELPSAVATLACGGPASAMAVAAERARIERLIRRGSRRRWLAYLHDVTGLIERAPAGPDPALAAARDRATAVIVNHHNLLLAHPGAGARLTAGDLARLTAPDGGTR